MFKHLKLYKALYLVVIGFILFALAMVIKSDQIIAFKFLLSFSGVLLIVGSVMLLCPILFAKKIDNEGKEVELKSVEIDNELNKTD